MKIKIYLFLQLLIIPGLLLAQQETLEISLQKAMDLGIQNRLDLKNQQLQMEIAQNETKKLGSKNLPQITGTADFRYWTTLQTNILPGSALATPAFPYPQDRVIQFGLPYNNNIGVNLKQNIYDPSNQADRKISRVNTETQKLLLEESVTNIKLVIAQAYCNVLLTQEKHAMSKTNWHRNNLNFAYAKEKSDNKNLIKSDLDRAALNLQNAEISLQKDSSNMELSKYYLLNQLGMNLDKKLVLTDKLEVVEKDPAPTPEAEPNLQRVEIKREKNSISFAEINIKKQQYGHLPSVFLYGNYTYQQLSRDFKFFDGNTWYPYNYIGLQVNVPIFDGFLKSRTRSEFLLKKKVSENTIEKLKMDIRYELQSSFAALTNAYANMQYAKANYMQAQDLMQVYQLRFQEGASLYSEVLNTLYSLQTAQNNLMNAYYDYLVSKLNWQKAKGEL